MLRDGDQNTRWTTGEQQREGQWIEVDLARFYTFDAVTLTNRNSPNDFPRRYALFVSSNGIDWGEPLVDSANESGGITNGGITTEITIPETTARYIRVEQSGSSNRFWWSIHELTVALFRGSAPEPALEPAPQLVREPVPDDAHPDIVRVVDIDRSDIVRQPGGRGWADSYSMGDQCYCVTTFDHNIADIWVNTSIGRITVRAACEAIGPGPGAGGNPLYNDVQCGNGPANDAGDEDYCPGRVDIGKTGCIQIGPTWKFPENIESVSVPLYFGDSQSEAS